MKNQKVRDWMTSNPITITPQTTMPEAYRLLHTHDIRHLPVINKDKLIGIVTKGDLRQAQPSDATVLSVYEINYLLDKITAKEFMTPNPIAVSPDTAIREAARLMVLHKIGGLPVVEDGNLIGIITETDLCRILMLQTELSE